jgi:hypothetical protein
MAINPVAQILWLEGHRCVAPTINALGEANRPMVQLLHPRRGPARSLEAGGFLRWLVTVV